MKWTTLRAAGRKKFSGAPILAIGAVLPFGASRRTQRNTRRAHARSPSYRREQQHRRRACASVDVHAAVATATCSDARAKNSVSSLSVAQR